MNSDSKAPPAPSSNHQGCVTCGEPATLAVLADPFGKSDKMLSYCGEHAPQAFGWGGVEKLAEQRNTALAENEQLRALLRDWLKGCPNPPYWHWSFDLNIRTTNALGGTSAVETSEKDAKRVQEIYDRHDRVNRLLYSGPPGIILGPMDSDAAHQDRGFLLSILTLEQRGSPEKAGGEPERKTYRAPGELP